ncbi:MAG: hypothetical protein JOZ23_15490 [Mycobacterium sp.]|nr:hypothetical protein [Mycobacterium sp.]
MTAPEDPYFPPPQYPDAPALPRVHAPTRRSPIDIVVTSVMFVFAGVAGLLSFWYSLFFAMATDSCGDNCNFAALDWAYVVTWGGIATAGIVAIVGTIVAAARGRPMWIWPTLAFGVIVVAIVTGVLLSNSVIPHG